MAMLLKGADAARALTEQLREQAEELKKNGTEPCLAILRVGARVRVVRIVRVDHERYAVAAFEEYLLDLVPHLAVTYDSCFHIFPDFRIVQIPYGGCGAGRRCRLCLHAAGAACPGGNLL